MAGRKERFTFEERLLAAMDKTLSKLERVPRQRVQRERQVKRGIGPGAVELRSIMLFHLWLEGIFDLSLKR